MKRLMSVMCVAVACSATAVMAQSTPPMDQGKAKTDKKMMKNGPVTVTGCVADMDATGRYMLTNGMMADHMSTTPPSSPAPRPMAMSYALSGGDLKAHVGHKVQVTGTLEMAKDDKTRTDTMGKKTDATAGTTGTSSAGTSATGATAHGAAVGTMDHDKMMGHDKMMSHTLKVKSVKMLANTCQ